MYLHTHKSVPIALLCIQNMHVYIYKLNTHTFFKFCLLLVILPIALVDSKVLSVPKLVTSFLINNLNKKYVHFHVCTYALWFFIYLYMISLHAIRYVCISLQFSYWEEKNVCTYRCTYVAKYKYNVYQIISTNKLHRYSLNRAEIYEI